MRLLEVIAHPDTDRKLMDALSRWIDHRLGKGLVEALDTVNFIANRIGVFANQVTLKHMADLKLNIETVDAITGKLMGRPSSATFRTMDVVGLDTFVHVANNTFDKA
ncbi:MAG: 3-hydroxyacyl-CoA dehydrogenase, partial [Proteobacteria bacterium]|nr:3-hydroxyacyl-CoA dehydrogenase [Pseudomonadota bacterium]